MKTLLLLPLLLALSGCASTALQDVLKSTVPVTTAPIPTFSEHITVNTFGSADISGTNVLNNGTTVTADTLSASISVPIYGMANYHWGPAK